MDTDYIILESVVRQLYASAVWTHKIQEKESDIKKGIYNVLSVIDIVFLSTSTSGVIRACFSSERILIIATAIISFLSLMILLYLKLIDPLHVSNNHKMAANRVLAIRDELLILLSDIHRKSDLDMIDKKLSRISNELHAIYNEIPSTSKTAVKSAKTALKKQEYTYSDKEIDMFLPKSLRRG